MGPQPIASLGLVGDGDDSDIVRDLERAFGVDFGQRPETWTTVGDIERDLLALYPATETAGSCGTAMAFRHLRAALPSAARRARPGALLASLVPGSTSRRLAEHFGNEGLVVAASHASVTATVGFLAIPAGLFMLPFGYVWAAATLVATGVTLVAFDRGSPRDATPGELARETAAMNFAAFAARGADRRRAAIFEAVRRILAATSGIEAGRIARDTRLYD